MMDSSMWPPQRHVFALLVVLCIGADQPTPRPANDPLAKQPDFLPVDKAFALSARLAQGVLTARWDMPDGYYLYRHGFSIEGGEGTELATPAIPAGKAKVDEYFGASEVYYNHVEIVATVTKRSAESLTVHVTYQGCADYGLCYPPQRRLVSFSDREPQPVISQVAHATKPDVP